MMKRRHMGAARVWWTALPILLGGLLLAWTVPAAAADTDWPAMKHHTHKHFWYPYDSWGSGGFWVGGFAPDLDDLSDQLEAAEFAALDGPLFMVGGGGFGAWDNWSFGGFGGGGQISSKRTDSEGEDQYAELSAGYGVAEVARLWPMNGVRLETGAMFGGGGATLRLSSGRPSNTDDALGNRFDTLLERGFFLVGPSAGVQVDLSDYVGLRVKGGYLLALGDDWTYRGSGPEMTGLPDMSGPFFSIGLTFGGKAPSRGK